MYHFCRFWYKFQEVTGERVRTDVIDEARFVKTPYEIGRIAHASEVISEGHEQLPQHHPAPPRRNSSAANPAAIPIAISVGRCAPAESAFPLSPMPPMLAAQFPHPIPDFAAYGDAIAGGIAARHPDAADEVTDFVSTTMSGLSAKARSGHDLPRLLATARLAGRVLAQILPA